MSKRKLFTHKPTAPLDLDPDGAMERWFDENAKPSPLVPDPTLPARALLLDEPCSGPGRIHEFRLYQGESVTRWVCVNCGGRLTGLRNERPEPPPPPPDRYFNDIEEKPKPKWKTLPFWFEVALPMLVGGVIGQVLWRSFGK